MTTTRWVLGILLTTATTIAAHADAPPPPPMPTVTIETPTSKGEGFDGKAALAVVNAQNAKLLACYDKSALKSERAHATLAVRVDGKVATVKLVKVAADFEPCTRGVLATLVFAKAKAAYTVDADIMYANGTDGEVAMVGTGHYVTGNGYGVGGGGGGGCGGRRTNNTSVPTVSIGEPDVKGGSLDRAIIRRYIKRNINKIQYCYEKNLLADATGKLAGTIAVRFKILAVGTVDAASIKADAPKAMKEVGTCVGTVIQDIEFPKPKDGVDVTVRYPFTFKRSSN